MASYTTELTKYMENICENSEQIQEYFESYKSNNPYVSCGLNYGSFCGLNDIDTLKMLVCVLAKKIELDSVT